MIGNEIVEVDEEYDRDHIDQNGYIMEEVLDGVAFDYFM